MSEYVLYVYCRRNGVSCDAGEHDRIETDDEQAALRRLHGNAVGLRYHYDEIAVKIVKDGETLEEYVV